MHKCGIGRTTVLSAHGFANDNYGTTLSALTAAAVELLPDAGSNPAEGDTTYVAETETVVMDNSGVVIFFGTPGSGNTFAMPIFEDIVENPGQYRKEADEIVSKTLHEGNATIHSVKQKFAPVTPYQEVKHLDPESLNKQMSLEEIKDQIIRENMLHHAGSIAHPHPTGIIVHVFSRPIQENLFGRGPSKSRSSR